MKALKCELKIIYKKEVVIGAENTKTAEEILQTMIATGQEFDVSDEEMIGVLVEKKSECSCSEVCENCPYFCPENEDCMMEDMEKRCEDCEYLCPQCGKCTLEDHGECGEEECKKCFWCCPECGGCLHPEGVKKL